MMSRKSHASLIATVFLLVAAAASATPAAGVEAPSAIEWTSCEVNASPDGYCSFECKTGLSVYVQLTSGDGTITAQCGNSTVAECSGAGCEGSKRYTGTSSSGDCNVDGTGVGICWVGERLPETKVEF